MASGLTGWLRRAGARRLERRPGPGPAFRLSAAVALLATCPAFARDAGPSIRGTLVGLDGKPASGVHLELRQWSPLHARGLEMLGLAAPEIAAEATSGPRGRFEITAPAIGAYELLIVANGAAAIGRRYLPLLSDEQQGEVALVARRDLTVAVRDDDGEPLEGALVLAEPVASTRDGESDRFRPVRATGRTDPEGRLRLEVAAGARSEVRVVAPGRLPIRRVAVGRQLGVSLPRTPTRTVEVRDPDGRAAVHALVQRNGDEMPLGLTGEDGRLEVPLVTAPTVWTITSTSGDRARLRVPARPTAPPEDREAPPPPLLVELERGLEITGKVVDAVDGVAIGSAAVWPGGRAEDLALSSPEGLYSLRTPASGAQITLHAAALGFTHAETQASCPPCDGAGGRTVPTLALEPSGRVEGTVVDPGGEPIANAEVTVATRPGAFPRPPWELTVVASTAADGAFALDGLPYGATLDLRATHERFAEVQREVQPLERERPREPIRLRLARGITGTGTVVDAQDRPLAGASVTLSPKPKRATPWAWKAWSSWKPVTTITDDEGTFRFEAIHAGVYDLEARRTGFARTRVPGVDVEVEDGETEAPIGTVVLIDGARVEGRVVDADGVAVPEVGIAVTEQVSRGTTSREREVAASSGPDGRFVLDDLTPGLPVVLDALHPTLSAASPAFVRPPTDEPLEIVVRPKRIVRGVVLDSGGSPLPGATVFARITTRNGSSMTRAGSAQRLTDSRGRFELDIDSAGADPEVELFASARGHRQTRRVLEPAHRPDEEIILRLEEGASVTGRVSGPDGVPTIGASVSALPRAGDTGRDSGLNSGHWGLGATTDGDGRYRIDGLSPGLYDVEASRFGWLPARRSVGVEVAEAILDLELGEGLAIEGTVFDLEARPAAGVAVQLIRLSGAIGNSFRGNERVVTGSDGGYRIGGLAAGSYELRGLHPDLGETRTRVTLEDGSARGVDLRFEPGVTVTGRVTGLELDELSQVLVSASPRQTSGVNEGRNASPDHRGEFELLGLTPGRWTVSARRPSDGRVVAEAIEIERGLSPDPVELHFDLEGFTLEGTVWRAEEPVSGARITIRLLHPTPDGQGTVFATTDPSGAFRIEGLEQGTWQVRAVADQASWQDDVEVSGDVDLEIELRDALLLVRVVDAESQAPLPGARLQVLLSGGMVRAVQTSDRDGVAELRIGPGSFTLDVDAEGFATARRSIELAAGNTRELEIAMERASSLLLDVLDPDGRPFPGRVRISLLDDQGERTVSSTPTTRVGRYEVTAVPDGRQTLQVQAEGFAPVKQDPLLPSDTPLVVRLVASGSIRVFLPDLTAVTKAFVVAVDPGWDAHEVTPSWRDTLAGAPLIEGRALLTEVPPGTVRLLVQLQTVRVESKPGGPTEPPVLYEGLVEVVAGETAEAVLTPGAR